MLRASAVLLSGGAAGALLTHSLSTEARAETEFWVAGDEVVIRNEEIVGIRLTLGFDWAYAVPSGEEPKEVVVDVLVGTDADNMTVVETTTSEEYFLESYGEETADVDLINEGVIDADEIVPDEGGETEETELHVGVEMRLYDENDMVIAADSKTDTATVSVELEDYDPDEFGELAGGGEITIEVE